MIRWVLLRGLARQAEHWGPLRGLIETRFGAPPLCLDLPGMGSAADQASPGQISAITDLLRTNFLSRKSGHENWGLMGISMGGMIAMDWLHRFPSDFQQLVLINSSTSDLSRPWERMRPLGLWKLLDIARTKDLRQRELAILSLTTNMLKIDEALLEEWVQIQEKTPFRLNAAFQQIQAAARFRSPKTLPLKPLVLVGEKDLLVSPECSRKIANNYEAELRSHPEAGHDLSLDDPEWVMAQLDRFLQG